MTIERVEAWVIDFPLSRPVVLGNLRFESRDYCVVRVSDREGASGFGYVMSRGAPMALTVKSLAPLMVGRSPWDSESIWTSMYEYVNVKGQRGDAARALSILDIAIWDLKGRLVERPIYQLLGGFREEIDISIGGAYFRDSRPPDEIEAELREYVRSGYKHVKIPAGGLSSAAEEQWVGAAREAVGDDVALAVDSHWTWQDVTTAREVIDRFEPFHLAWVEDPIWAEAVQSAARLRKLVRTPIAIGDEQSGRWAYQNLLAADAADIWRVDAGIVGGITEFRRVAALASFWGIPLSTHMYPEIHLHCAAAEPAVRWVEHVDSVQEIDFTYKLVSNPCRPVEGRARPSTDGGGLGFELDWEMVTERALNYQVFTIEDL